MLKILRGIFHRLLSKLSKGKKKTTELDDLILIKGIGEETLADIKRSYKSINQLKSALRTGTVPLRNDVVEKLEKALL